MSSESKEAYYISYLQDLYGAEHQSIEFLSRIATSISSSSISKQISTESDRCRERANRIERILRRLGVEAEERAIQDAQSSFQVTDELVTHLESLPDSPQSVAETLNLSEEEVNFLLYHTDLTDEEKTVLDSLKEEAKKIRADRLEKASRSMLSKQNRPWMGKLEDAEADIAIQNIMRRKLEEYREAKKLAQELGVREDLNLIEVNLQGAEQAERELVKALEIVGAGARV